MAAETLRFLSFWEAFLRSSWMSDMSPPTSVLSIYIFLSSFGSLSEVLCQLFTIRTQLGRIFLSLFVSADGPVHIDVWTTFIEGVSGAVSCLAYPFKLAPDTRLICGARPHQLF